MKMPICKPRLWNLGIGIEFGIEFRIGIGTDIRNVIASASIRPMDPKLSRVVTQDEGPTPTKSHDTSITWSGDHVYKTYGPQNLAGC